MSLSATLFGTDSAIYKVTNVLGLGIPGLLNKWFGAKAPEDQVQRIGELANQTAKEGGARPIIWGRVRPISGNIMHVSTPRIVRVEVESEDSGGGKGGGKKKAAKQYQERVYRTYAIRICEGPITAVIRVWRNSKLVYDARGNAWGAKNNGVFMRTFRFRLGGWDQMPDATLEGIWGAGNVPGYRGTCYMVAVDEDLTEMGGSVPQYVFEVERAEGTYLTSRPYQIESAEYIAASPYASELALIDPVQQTQDPEYIGFTPSIEQLSLSDTSPEIADYLSPSPSVVELYRSDPIELKPEYLLPAPEIEYFQFSITYDNQEPEGLACTPSCTELALV